MKLFSGCSTIGKTDTGGQKMKTIKKKLLPMILVILLGMCGILSSGCSAKAAPDHTGEMTVHFLDVGQGLSIFVQSGEETLLYDGGDKSSSSFVVSYLKEQKVKEIDYLISSHYDEDHVSGLVGCLNTFKVKKVIGADYVHDSGIYESFMEGVRKQGLEVCHPKVGECFPFGTGTFTILSPAEINEKDSNENSVAVKLTNGDNAFLFMGDAEYKSEERILDSKIDLECDVLSVGHHGSASSTSWDFLEAAVPEYAVISCGAGNPYGHPDADTMEKLEAMEIEVYRSDKQGTVLCTTDGQTLTWSQEPCGDYTPGDPKDKGTRPGGSSSEQNTSESGVASLGKMVWIPASGKKYHTIPDCGKMNPDTAEKIPLAMAKILGYTPCKKCN